jgi:uncharacterized membrane protein
MPTSEQFKRNPFSDTSLWFLLFSNIVTIFFVIIENWNLSTIILIYWFQSIIIGFFNFIRILQLKEFSTEGLRINDSPAQPTQRTKISIAFFFLFHYGFFHIISLIFLLIGPFPIVHGNRLDHIESKYILLISLIFFINHLFSYLYNRPKDTKKQNIGLLMFYPYLRIIPMDLTIILGSSFGGVLPLFLVLKTFADGIMHVVEHNFLRKGEEGQTQTI